MKTAKQTKILNVKEWQVITHDGTLGKIPIFGIGLSVVVFLLGTLLFKNKWIFPIRTFILQYGSGILFLKKLQVYHMKIINGGDIINFFLELTICFAIPYKKREVLKKHWHHIMGGIAVGTVSALVIIYIVAKAFQFGDDIIASMLPQAATTAIALPVSEGISGIKELTSLAVILNAVIIMALGNKLLKLFNITNPIARGLALGTSGHTLGVAAAKELGEVEESMASISLVLVGVVVVAVVPIFVLLLL